MEGIAAIDMFLTRKGERCLNGPFPSVQLLYKNFSINCDTVSYIMYIIEINILHVNFSILLKKGTILRFLAKVPE